VAGKIVLDKLSIYIRRAGRDRTRLNDSLSSERSGIGR